jgi:GTP-binding protein Era
MVFLDTPGIHIPKSKVNKFMVNQALGVFPEADVICMIIEAGAKMDSDNQTIIKRIKSFKGPVFLVVNKIDLIPLAEAEKTAEIFQQAFDFEETIFISAFDKNDADNLLKKIAPKLPGDMPYYPEDILTSSTERFICEEFIREKIFLLTGEELPYSCAVEVTRFDEQEDIINIYADIHVERDSQKGMIIGKKGRMIKKIGSHARADIEKLLDIKIFLDLNVRVQKNWTKDEKALERFGYGKKPT